MKNKPLGILMALAIVFFIFALAYANLSSSKQPQEQTPQERIEKKEFSLPGTRYKISYHIAENETIKITKLERYRATVYTSIFYDNQLRNEVILNKHDIFVYDNIENGEKVIFTYIGSYPTSKAIIKSFDNTDKAKDYVKSKTGKEPTIVKKETGN